MLVQVIPLHLPAGDTSTERTVHIDGTHEQIEIAKQLGTKMQVLDFLICYASRSFSAFVRLF